MDAIDAILKSIKGQIDEALGDNALPVRGSAGWALSYGDEIAKPRISVQYWDDEQPNVECSIDRQRFSIIEIADPAYADRLSEFLSAIQKQFGGKTDNDYGKHYRVISLDQVTPKKPRRQFFLDE